MLISPSDDLTLFAMVVLCSLTAVGLLAVIPDWLLRVAAMISVCIMFGEWLAGLV
jgi:hypothetical protein